MKLSILALFLAPSISIAHGSYAHQASEAIEATVVLFESSQPVSVQRDFDQINAKKVEHEQFDVTITLKTSAVLKYSCAENETVNPAVWECVAN